MRTVTDRYGRKPINSVVEPDVLDRYGRQALKKVEAPEIVDVEPFDEPIEEIFDEAE